MCIVSIGNHSIYFDVIEMITPQTLIFIQNPGHISMFVGVCFCVFLPKCKVHLGFVLGYLVFVAYMKFLGNLPRIYLKWVALRPRLEPFL